VRIQEVERVIQVPVIERKIEVVQDKIVVVDREFQIVEKFTQKPVVVEKEVIRQVPVMVEKTVVVNNDVPHVYEI
jgi:hypothetical protein